MPASGAGASWRRPAATSPGPPPRWPAWWSARWCGRRCRRAEIGQLNSHALASAAEGAADRDRLDESLRLAILAARGNWLQPADASARTALARAADGNRLQLHLVDDHDGGGVASSFSGDGRQVLTASRDGRARLWDAASGERLRLFPAHDSALTGALLRPDGRQVLTTSEDHSAHLWDARTGEPVGAPMQHAGSVVAAAFSEDGRRLITADADKATIWTSGRGVEARGPDEPVAGPAAVAARAAPAMQDEPRSPIFRVAFSPDGQRALVAHRRRVTLHDVGSGRRLAPPLQHCSRFLQAELSADGRRVVTVDEENRLRVWAGAPAADGDGEADGDDFAAGPVQVLRDRRVAALAISPDGRHILGADADGGSVYRVGPATPVAGRLPPDGTVRAAAFSPDKHVALMVSGARVRLLSLDPDDPWGQSLDHDAAVTAARFSTDGSLVATTAEDGTARLWDARTGLPPSGVAPMRGRGPLVDVALDAQRQRLATLSRDGQVQLWAVADGRPLGRPLQPEAPVQSLRFSADGEWLLTLGRGDLQLWRAADGQPARRWTTLPGALRAIDLSPDARRVLTLGRDGAAQLWDLASGRPLAAPLAHEGRVEQARFSGDGRRVLTVSDDRSAQVWDGETGHPLGSRAARSRNTTSEVRCARAGAP